MSVHQQSKTALVATSAIVLHGLTLLDKDAIKKDQDGIGKAMKNLDQRIHNNAVQCLLHAEQFGDTSLMRRLFIDVLKTSGYRVQGMANWMRIHSPMELKGDNINLSGIIANEQQRLDLLKRFTDDNGVTLVDPKLFIVGERRPFLTDIAAKNHFTTDAGNAELVKPIFQGVIVDAVNSAIKRARAAMENTVEGKDGKPNTPIDPAKPFYDGLQMGSVREMLDGLEAINAKMPKDNTREVRQAQAEAARLGLTVVAGDKKAA